MRTQSYEIMSKITIQVVCQTNELKEKTWKEKTTLRYSKNLFLTIS